MTYECRRDEKFNRLMGELIARNRKALRDLEKKIKEAYPCHRVEIDEDCQRVVIHGEGLQTAVVGVLCINDALKEIVEKYLTPFEGRKKIIDETLETDDGE